jgi:D-alanyl-D-alanine carboxypeptidase
MITFDPLAVRAEIQSIADAVRQDGNAAAVVAEVSRGALTVRLASGVADTDSGKAAPADGAYEIGSQTKTMTAVMILQLMQEGKIDLDARAADYLPAATVQGIQNADLATVRQLLDMTAGIGNYTEAVGEDGLPLFVRALLDHPDQVFGPEQALAIARTMTPTGAPGADYAYSNTNYVLLGQIVEHLTGQTFFDALQARALTPAGMENTLPQLATGDDRLHSYATAPGGNTVDVTRALWEMRGEAGVVSTNDDMMAFLRALLVNKTLLGTEALAEMTDFFVIDVTDTSTAGRFEFGLGLLRISMNTGETFIGFNGDTLGTSSSTYLETTTGALVALAATSFEADSMGGAFAIWQEAEGGLWEAGAIRGAISVGSISAADLLLAGGEAMTLSASGVTLQTARDLRAVTQANLSFTDGSVLLVGDKRSGTTGDDLGNRLDVARDAPLAVDKNNQLMGLGGNDTLVGGNGNDRLSGGSGRDTLEGGAGNDKLMGGSGRDILEGGAGNDRLVSADGNDRLSGGSGRDTLEGGAGHDKLMGGSGRDILEGGAGNDTLIGGSDADTFLFTSADRGRDVIRDFKSGVDRIDLSDHGKVTLTQSHGNLVIVAEDLSVILLGVTDLAPGDLIL